jgi:hypothetical protein
MITRSIVTMKKGYRGRVCVLFMFSLLLVGLLSASVFGEVGVGVSPSKWQLVIQGGTEQTFELLVFNTGDMPMEINVGASDSIESFTTITPSSAIIEPEPRPHELPIKNGKKFTVTFKPPISGEEKQYSGQVAAVGKPSGAAQFGGSVGVATVLEMTVTPPESIFAFITATHILIFVALVLLIFVFMLLRKAGFHLRLERE